MLHFIIVCGIFNCFHVYGQPCQNTAISLSPSYYLSYSVTISLTISVCLSVSIVVSLFFFLSLRLTCLWCHSLIVCRATVRLYVTKCKKFHNSLYPKTKKLKQIPMRHKTNRYVWCPYAHIIVFVSLKLFFKDKMIFFPFRLWCCRCLPPSHFPFELLCTFSWIGVIMESAGYQIRFSQNSKHSCVLFSWCRVLEAPFNRISYPISLLAANIQPLKNTFSSINKMIWVVLANKHYDRISIWFNLI